MNTLNKIGLAFIVLGIACCKDKHIDIFKKPEPVLPPITMEGKNTIGCMVNGHLYLPNEYGDRARCDYYPWSSSHEFYGSVSITSKKDYFKENDLLRMTVQMRNRIFGTGKHLVYTNNKEYLRIIINDTNYYENYAHDPNNFFLISRLDTTNRIISGTFQFTLIKRYNNLDTLKITDGRFDFRF